MGFRKEKREIPKIIFDTDVLIWYFRGNQRAKEFLIRVPYEDRLISSLCAMELVQGCVNRLELKALKDFLKTNVSDMIHPDERVSERALSLLERYSLSHGLRTVDALVAASALTARATLATANYRHYKNIGNLDIMRFEP